CLESSPQFCFVYNTPSGNVLLSFVKRCLEFRALRCVHRAFNGDQLHQLTFGQGCGLVENKPSVLNPRGERHPVSVAESALPWENSPEHSRPCNCHGTRP